MTREEAKLILEEIHDSMYDGYMNILASGGKLDTTLENGIEAYEVAISALSEPPRPKGRWEIYEQLREFKAILKCSVCGRDICVPYPYNKKSIIKGYPYCHCGADMREEK